MIADVARCVRPHRQLQPPALGSRTAEVSPRLCTPCVDRIRTDLTALPSLYEECEQALLTLHHGSVIRRLGRTGTADLPISEAAAHARGLINGVLASWTDVVVYERRISRPPQRQVRSLAEFLVTHVDWLAAHRTAADFADEVEHVVSAAYRAIDSDDTRPVELGTCVEPGCHATLVAQLGTHEGPTSRIHCAAGHSWPAHQWLLLSRRLTDGSRT